MKKKQINFSFGEPFLATEIISSINIKIATLSKGCGLSYTDYPTIINNNKFIVNNLYKNILNINLNNEEIKIIIGIGTTQLFNAYNYSINKIENKNIDILNNNSISYNLYRNICEKTPYLNYNNSIFTLNNEHTKVNFIISPNMPTGEIFNEKINDDDYYLCDVCLDYPCFTMCSETCNKKIYSEFNKKNNITIISSFSKIGIPGVHFGFLITKNNKIEKYVNEFIDFNILAYPPALSIITKKIYDKYLCKKYFYNKIKKIIIYRKKKIIYFFKSIFVQVINVNNINDSFPFLYTDKSIDWWKINHDILTKPGRCFEESNKNSRFDLLMSNENFKILNRKISKY